MHVLATDENMHCRCKLIINQGNFWTNVNFAERIPGPGYDCGSIQDVNKKQEIWDLVNETGFEKRGGINHNRSNIVLTRK